MKNKSMKVEISRTPVGDGVTVVRDGKRYKIRKYKVKYKSFGDLYDLKKAEVESKPKMVVV